MISIISSLIHVPSLTRAVKTTVYKNLPLPAGNRLNVLLVQQQALPFSNPGLCSQFYALSRVNRLHSIVRFRPCLPLSSRRWTCNPKTLRNEWSPFSSIYLNGLLWEKNFLYNHQIANPYFSFRRYAHDRSSQNKLQTFKEKVFKDSRTAQPGKILFVAGLMVIRAIHKQARSDLTLKVIMQDPPKIVELKKFVQTFNTTLNNSPAHIDPLFKIALEHIDHYRFLGKLSPRQHPHPDIALARLAFLTLTECEDFAIRYEAFKQLKKLLKQAYNPTESIANLLQLEHCIGEKLKTMSEVHDPISFLHEQVVCYNLILEKIFLSTLQAGSSLSKNSQADVSLRSREISQKLGKNPAFQCEALNAKTLSEHLTTPCQLVTETVSAIFNLASLYQKTSSDISAILLENTTIKQRLHKLKQFILAKGSAHSEKAEKFFLHLEEHEVELEKNADFYASLLLFKPHWHSSVTNNSLQVIQNALKVILKDEKNWVALYRLVEVLAEITISKGQDPFRQQAFDEMVRLIETETAWQVRYKIGSVLLQLKNDILFEDQAEEHWQRHLAIPVVYSQVLHALRLFAATQEKIKAADQRLQAHRHFQPLGRLKDRIDSIQQNLLIPREVFLEQLANQFANCYQPLPIQIILGMRGGGKTILATMYAQEYAKDYTLVHWIDSGTLEQDLSMLADRVGIPTVQSKVVKSIEERMDLLKKWLEDKPNQGWLLVIDNVDPKDCQKIKSFLPCTGGHLLMTTYHEHEVKEQFTAPLLLKLPLFSVLEATHYLLQMEKHTKEDRIPAKQICEELGYLPLPLSHARAYIDKMGCSLTEYLRLYQEHKTKLFEGGVVTTWDMNFEEIKKRQPLALELLSFLAELYPHAIPYFLIRTWQFMRKQKTDETEILKTLKELREFAVIGGSNSVYNMHLFLQEVIKKSFNQKEQELHSHHILIVMRAAAKNIDVEDPRSWSTMNLLIPHYERLVQKNPTQENAELIVDLNHHIGICFWKLGDFTKAKEKIEGALAMQRKLYKTDEHPDVQTSLNNLGAVLHVQGDLLGAKANFEQSLSIKRKLHKTDEHPTVVNSMHNLGNVLQDQGSLVAAKAYNEQALAIRKKLYKTDDHPNIAASLNNLGLVLRDQGDLLGAKASCEQALAIKRKLYKTDEHPTIAASLNNLGSVLQEQGDWIGAKANYEQALAINRRLYKKDEHPEVIVSLNGLGMVLRDQGNWVAAKANLEQSLAIQKKLYKTDEHPNIAHSLNNLGLILIDQGDLVGAKVNFEQSLAITRKLYKTDEHPDVQISLNNLGSVLQKQGDWIGAKAIYEQSLAITRKLYKTDEHPTIAGSLNNLGLVLRNQGDLVGAKANFDQSLTITRKLYKTDEHPHIAAFLYNLGLILAAQGDWTGAKANFVQTLAIQRKLFKTDDHPSIKKTLKDLDDLQKKFEKES